MALTDVEKLRQRLGDAIQFNIASFIGDGVTRLFRLPHQHIQEADFEVTPSTGTTIDYEKGTITYAVAPANETDIEVEYYYSAFTDEELQELIDTEGGVYQGGVAAIEILLADAVRRHDYKLADGDYKESQIFKQLKEMRAMFQGHVDSENEDDDGMGGAIVAKKRNRYVNSVDKATGMDRRNAEIEGRSRLEDL